MNTEQLVQAIIDYCNRYASDENILKYSRYFKEGLYKGYGLSAPQIYAGAKEMISEKPQLYTVLSAAPEIFSTEKYDAISILMLTVKELHKEFTHETFEEIAGWYRMGIDNWAHADTLGMLILPLFFKKKLVDIADFKKWLKSENKYQRRSVPVTFIKVMKAGRDCEELFRFTEILMTDREREVHQGMGWFLRESWKRHPEVTVKFLLKWKDITPRLIVQYATEKMSKEEKLQFKRVR
ncbi:MAG TPA: DNA alkylation repair protein [Bacteroidales bacterium]|nr:DNA alkylation repair protein [Bacteroidales bacterium]